MDEGRDDVLAWLARVADVADGYADALDPRRKDLNGERDPLLRTLYRLSRVAREEVSASNA